MLADYATVSPTAITILQSLVAGSNAILSAPLLSSGAAAGATSDALLQQPWAVIASKWCKGKAAKGNALELAACTAAAGPNYPPALVVAAAVVDGLLPNMVCAAADSQAASVNGDVGMGVVGDRVWGWCWRVIEGVARLKSGRRSLALMCASSSSSRILLHYSHLYVLADGHIHGTPRAGGEPGGQAGARAPPVVR